MFFYENIWYNLGKSMSYICFIFFFMPWSIWSTSELRVRLAQWNEFNPTSKILLLTVPRRHFFCGSIVLFMSCDVMLLRLFIAALWSPAGKGLTSLLSFVMFNCVFCQFPMWHPGLGVVLDCIDSWSLSPFFLWFRNNTAHWFTNLVFKQPSVSLGSYTTWFANMSKIIIKKYNSSWSE